MESAEPRGLRPGLDAVRTRAEEPNDAGNRPEASGSVRPPPVVRTFRAARPGAKRDPGSPWPGDTNTSTNTNKIRILIPFVLVVED